MPDHLPRIVIDFDGVLHSYVSGWQGAATISDAPTTGALDFVRGLIMAGWDVIVMSTRADSIQGREAMFEWLETWGFPGLKVTHSKPPALVYLDDRALRFDGPDDWPTMPEIERAARPWTQRLHEALGPEGATGPTGGGS